MIKTFAFYLEKNKAAKISPDRETAKSLMNNVGERLRFLQTINKKFPNIVFETVYEIIRESVNALMLLEGYKPYSHEAVIAFLERFYTDRFTEYDLTTLNDLRIKRNNSLYRGEKISSEYANKSIKFLDEIIPKIKQLYEEYIYK